MLLTNNHVMTTHSDGAVLYRSTRDPKHGGRVLTLLPDDPAVVFLDQHAGAHTAWLKSKFQAAQKPTADAALIAEATEHFKMPITQFRDQMRTVGCGTTLYLILADGIFQTAVQRTAPKTGKIGDTSAEGVVNLGAYSRAAGGATGPIGKSREREFAEECFIFVNLGNNRMASLDIKTQNADVSSQYMAELSAHKFKRLAKIIPQLPPLLQRCVFETQDHTATPLSIPGLTENVTQIVAAEKTLLTDQITLDDQNNADFNIDQAICLRLPGVKSSQIHICDGETDFDDKLLNRKWFVKPAQYFQDGLKEGTMKFSPLPAKVLQYTNEIHAEIARMQQRKLIL